MAKLGVELSTPGSAVTLTQFKDGPKTVVAKHKCIDYIEKGLFMILFLYNL